MMQAPFTLTPGARVARRGHFGVRPGQPDFAEMSMVQLGDELHRNVWLQSLFGNEMEIKFLGGKGVLRIEVRQAPPA